MSLSKLHDIKKPMKHYASNYRPSGTSVPLKRASVVPPRKSFRSSERSHSGGRGLWYLAGILIVGLFFGLSVFFTGATVTITPTIENTPLNERFIAHKKSVSKELTFDVMIVDGEISEKITGESKQNVEEPARGLVRIFNNHDAQKQALRIDTRLVDDEGRIYKTVKAVDVPGQTTKDGETIPGYVDVEIYADKPGEDYNYSGEEKTLRLLGFKESNSPKYETVYAKTQGDLSGGFAGERYVVEETKKQQIVTDLTNKLKKDLIEKSRAQIPEQILYPENLATLINTKVSETVDGEGVITLTLSGSLFNPLFNSVEFEKYILETSIVGVTQETAYIANLRELAISYVDESSQTVDPESLENLAFEINDVLEIISIVNKESLVFELVGQKKKDFSTIISKHPGVEFVEYDINPFWRTRFPDKDEDIIITLTTEVEN